jgi:hypothetical protein
MTNPRRIKLILKTRESLFAWLVPDIFRQPNRIGGMNNADGMRPAAAHPRAYVAWGRTWTGLVPVKGGRCRRPLFIYQLFAAFNYLVFGVSRFCFCEDNTSRPDLLFGSRSIVQEVERVLIGFRPAGRVVSGKRNDNIGIDVDFLVPRERGPLKGLHAHGLRKSRIRINKATNLKRYIFAFISALVWSTYKRSGSRLKLSLGFVLSMVSILKTAKPSSVFAFSTLPAGVVQTLQTPS